MKSIEEIMEMLDLFYALKHYYDRLTAQEYRRKAQAECSNRGDDDGKAC